MQTTTHRAGLALALIAAHGLAVSAAQADVLTQSAENAASSMYGDLESALIRLPLAAVLGTVLALRPRRRGTPERSMPVVETQIILAVVGALIMLVVGASLARAFGIVGAANLIRYRAKIDDPKDAVVMLAALALGLAAGVGQYALATFGALFVGAALWTIEGFEPEARKHFELTIKTPDADDLRPKIERVLERRSIEYELRSTADEAVSYDVRVPPKQGVDGVSEAIEHLVPGGDLAVEWDEKKSKKA